MSGGTGERVCVPLSIGERITRGCGPKPGSGLAILGAGCGSPGQARFLAACACVTGGERFAVWFCRTCARALLMAACALVSGVVGLCCSLGFGVLGHFPCVAPEFGVPLSGLVVATPCGREGPGSSRSSSESFPFVSSFFPLSSPLLWLPLLPLAPVRHRCSANSSSLISTSTPWLGTRAVFPWYSFSLSIVTTWVPLLLPYFQLGSGVILTMVSYLAGSAHTRHGPVQ